MVMVMERCGGKGKERRRKKIRKERRRDAGIEGRLECGKAGCQKGKASRA
jgi:hypothetical protein